MNELAREIVDINKSNGWNVLHPNDWFTNEYKIPAVLALIHSEVSEALEAYRKNDMENFSEELADVIIRCLDCAAGLDIDIDDEIQRKLEKNKQRGYRHGGKKL